MTAYGALIHYGNITNDDTVLITAASSSVGIAAIQIVKAVGGVAIATTRSAEKKAFLLETGADQVIVTDEEDLVERGMAITSGKGVRVVFDPVAGPLLEKLAAVTAPGGIIFEYGALSPNPTPFHLFQALEKVLNVRGYTIFEIVKNPEYMLQVKDYIYRGLESGSLKPIIDRTFPLENIVDAHRYMHSNQQKGKIVVTV